MNNKRRIFSLLFSLFLLLGSAPAWAVSPNGGARCVSRFNAAGSSFLNMTFGATTFCYLSSISFEETDTGGEEATCRLTRGGVWTLEAVLDANSDADAECCAYCYNN
jgi:hypothetical protein